MTLYVSPETQNAGNPVHKVPYPGTIFLGLDDTLFQLGVDKPRLFLPMVEVWGHAWEEVHEKLDLLVTVWPGDTAVVYRGPTVIGGGTSMKPEIVRQIEVGVMYAVPTMPSPEWTAFPDTKSWWGSLDLAILDQQMEEMLARRRCK